MRATSLQGLTPALLQEYLHRLDTRQSEVIQPLKFELHMLPPARVSSQSSAAHVAAHTLMLLYSAGGRCCTTSTR